MLSQKLQNDLMTAYQKVYEEKRGHAAGSDDTEKQASQLASDVRYKAKGKVPEGATEEEKRKIYLQILAASPAPNVVKSMAKEKLLGEEVVTEKLGLKMLRKANVATSRAAKKMDKGLTGRNVKRLVGRAVFGRTAAGKATRLGTVGTVAYMSGRKDEAGANIDRGNTVRDLINNKGFQPPSKIKPFSSQSVKYEETMLEDKKMSKQSDDDLAAAHKKFSGMDQSTPSNKFMLKRIEKEMKKRKTVKEGSAYGIYKGDGVMKVGKKEEEKAPRKQKGAMAYDGPNKERSEAADRVLAKTKKKREEKKKMKEEYVSEKMMAKKLMRKPIDPVNVATKAAGVAGAAGVGMAYKKTNESAGETIGEMKEKSKPKNLKDMSKGVEQKAPVDYRTLAQSYKPVGNIFNEKKLDAVGAEDKDIDNDGDHDSTDKYLLKRRKAIGKAIAKKRGKVKEGFSAWRIDLDFNEQVKK